MAIMRRQHALVLLLAGLVVGTCLSVAVAQEDAAAVDLSADSILFETFGAGWDDRWVHSEDDKYTGRFISVQPEGWSHPAIKIPEKSKHYGLTALLPEAVDPSGGLVVQYAVKFTEAISCGGAYVKLVTAAEGFQPELLKDDTPYTVMFGPDKCGTPGKVHLILRHKNLLSGAVVEHHLKDPPTPQADSSTHLYTLQIKPDNSYEIWIDGESKSKGSLLEKLEPPLVPPPMVDDPEDIKPKLWVNDDEMPDPTAVMPEDWDERREIPDESAFKPATWLDDEVAIVEDAQATQPEDWDDEEDGEWAAPQIPNPKCTKGGCGPWERPKVKNPAYKGPWNAPLVPNPDYKGPWVQKTMPNPDFYEDEAPLANLAGPIAALALEIWTIDDGYTFGGFLVAQDMAAANQYRDLVFKPLQALEKKAATDKLAVEAAERKAKSTASEPEPDLIHKVSGAIVAFFDRPTLRLAKPLVLPLLAALETSPEVVLALSVIGLLVTLFGIYKATRGKQPSAADKRKAARAARAKKTDEADSDDSADEAKPAPASPTPTPTPAPTSAKKSKAKPVGEISAEVDEDEEPVEAPKAARRRVPRAE